MFLNRFIYIYIHYKIVTFIRKILIEIDYKFLYEHKSS